MEKNKLTFMAVLLIDRKTVFTLSMLAIIAFSGYVVGFNQLPIAHDTFHELRHSIGLSCH